MLRTECQSQGLGTLCGLFGFTRQAYNKRNVSDGFAEKAIESIIIEKASDITYVETNEGVCYLSLITDLYSHKIVGWAVGPTLETVYPLEALKMAYKSIAFERISSP